MRKWAAGLALFAIVASGVGVAAAMIFGSMTAPKPSEQPPRRVRRSRRPRRRCRRRWSSPSASSSPIRSARPAAGCTYKYTIEPKYIGLHPLPETPFTVLYEVTGGNAPQHGEFTVTKDQAKILKDVVLEGPPGAQLKAIVQQVTG